MTPPRAAPIFFGPPPRSLFGWLHRPSLAQANIGLVICNPIGYEAVCAHRSLRHFAAAAAAAGIPALRFDYDGSGDSAGGDIDPDRLRAWIASIHAAIQELKAHTNVTQVCLLGVRLGATLAMLAAAEREDVAGVAVIAPVIGVRAYLRELRALALAGKQIEPPAWANVMPDLQETAGFALTPATRQELTGIDLLKQPARRGQVLVIDRDDMPPSTAWLEHLRGGGAQVQHLRLPGYTQMMLDAHETEIPQQMIAAVVGWTSQLRSAAPATVATAAEARVTAQFDVPTLDGQRIEVRETATFLDATRTVFGMVTAPAVVDPKPTLIMLLNSGAVHHIGPNRLYVALARLWAARGAIVLRMDLSGLGDSATRPGEPENVVYSERAREDIEAALNWMRQHYDVGQCHAVGLCSGAYHGFKFAAAGPALTSIVAINPLTFAARPGMKLAFPDHRIAADAMRYRRNAFDWSSWKKLLTGGVDMTGLVKVLAHRLAGSFNNAARDLARGLNVPLRNDLGTELQRLSRHNTDMLFVFAAEEPGLDMLRGGGGSAFRKLQRQGHLEVATVEGADHTFTTHWARERLISILTAHLQHQTADRS